MRWMLSILFCLSGFASLPAQTADGYVVNGVIRGLRAEGKRVYLVNAPWAISKVKITDSTMVKNGKFTFRGRLKTPELFFILVQTDHPKGSGKDIFGGLSRKFYLENSIISYSAHYDSLPTYYRGEDPTRTQTAEAIIKGSKSEEINVQFRCRIRAGNPDPEFTRSEDFARD